MKVPGSKIVPCQGVLGSNHSLTFGLFTQVSGSGPLGPLVSCLASSFRTIAQLVKLATKTYDVTVAEMLVITGHYICSC